MGTRGTQMYGQRSSSKRLMRSSEEPRVDGNTGEPPPRVASMAGLGPCGAAMLLLCACVCGCSSRREQFDGLYAEITSSNVTSTASSLRDYYPELAGKLSCEEFVKIAAICLEHGTLFAASRLAPYLENAEGEKKALLAMLVAAFSHGNHTGALTVLRQPPEGISAKCKAGVEDTLMRVSTMEYRDEWATDDAEQLGVEVSAWKAMSLESRWETIIKAVAEH